MSVFVGRWIALLRALVPPTAGMAGMPYRTFVLWNAMGGIAWASAYALIGYLAGDAAQKIAKQLSHSLLLVLVVAAAIVTLAVHIHRRHRDARDPEDATSPDAAGPSER